MAKRATKRPTKAPSKLEAKGPRDGGPAGAKAGAKTARQDRRSRLLAKALKVRRQGPSSKPGPAPACQSARRLAGTLVLVGAGKMGGAMLEGWLVARPAARARRGDRSATRQGGEGAGAQGRAHQSQEAERARPAVLVIAVKPQVAAEILPTLAPLVGPKTLVVSIMAGKPLSFMEGRCRPRPSCARCRTRRRRSAVASPWRSAMPGSRRPRGGLPMRCWRPPARSNGWRTRR